MELFLTRAITLVALTCFVIIGVAGAAILGRESLPVAAVDAAAGPVMKNPVSNKEGKQDRLAVVTMALAAFEPPQAPTQLQAAAPQAQNNDPVLTGSLRQAFASTAPADMDMPKMADPASPSKPKAVSKPQPQKYALLSDTQIAGIKDRLKLSSAQESYWPAVETALRAIARKIHATRQADPNAMGAPIDPDSDEVQKLKSAAMPLLFQLREDQKREVRSLARIIGLEKVASMI